MSWCHLETGEYKVQLQVQGVEYGTEVHLFDIGPNNCRGVNSSLSQGQSQQGAGGAFSWGGNRGDLGFT